LDRYRCTRVDTGVLSASLGKSTDKLEKLLKSFLETFFDLLPSMLAIASLPVLLILAQKLKSSLKKKKKNVPTIAAKQATVQPTEKAASDREALGKPHPSYA
jgi:hypothetical protein